MAAITKSAARVTTRVIAALATAGDERRQQRCAIDIVTEKRRSAAFCRRIAFYLDRACIFAVDQGNRLRGRASHPRGASTFTKLGLTEPRALSFCDLQSAWSP